VLFVIRPIPAPLSVAHASVEDLQQRVVGRLAAHLNPQMKEHAARPGMATESLEAHRAYAQGLERMTALDWRAATRHFADALAYDSTFIAPLLYSGFMFYALSDWAAIDSIVNRARPRMYRMHQLERRSLRVLEAFLRGDLEAAYRANVEVAELAPTGIWQWARANSATMVNRPHEAIRISNGLDPERGELRGWFIYWQDLSRAHHWLGQHADELDVVGRARELHPDEPEAVILEVSVLAALGRHDELRELLAAQRHLHLHPPALLRHAALELLYHGATTECEALLRESLEVQRVRNSGSYGR
jgi:hypothetical protein